MLIVSSVSGRGMKLLPRSDSLPQFTSRVKHGGARIYGSFSSCMMKKRHAAFRRLPVRFSINIFQRVNPKIRNRFLSKPFCATSALPEKWR